MATRDFKNTDVTMEGHLQLGLNGGEATLRFYGDNNNDLLAGGDAPFDNFEIFSREALTGLIFMTQSNSFRNLLAELQAGSHPPITSETEADWRQLWDSCSISENSHLVM